MTYSRADVQKSASVPPGTNRVPLPNSDPPPQSAKAVGLSTRRKRKTPSPVVSLDEDESTPSKRPKRRKTTFTTVQAATSAPATSQETPVPVTLEKKKRVKVRDTIEGSPERGSTAWKALSSAQKASPSATEAIGRGIHMLHPDSSRGSYAPSPHFPPILTSLCRRYKTTARRPTGAVWGRCGVGDRSAVCAGPRVEPHTHRNGPAFSVCRRRSTTSKHFFLT
ncbi:hypothetical protein V2G26_015708 [Clonostachys chloroleuca]